MAVSTGLLHDPDFFRLTIEQRYLWLMLLCYAGAVGVPFKLSPSDARVLFKLRRSAVFQPLIDQGFITLLQTGQTRQDKTGAPDAPVPVDKSKTDFYEPDEYPDGLNISAWKKWVSYRKKNKFRPYKTFDPMKNLASYTQEIQASAVRESINQGWQGLFPEKLKKAERVPASAGDMLAMAQKLGISTRGKTEYQLKKDLEARLGR